ncbi:MAG: 3-hydroxyacyl-CoA dehydrogenase/enoyl-CoA hydratase family protein [Deltaproteobacteria bacterium]|nr:3-hydroxyacyl-CoA dehydrogenase/enoyl-CoA hydratase family protein [Deltaproteobacteria bacterium]
MPLHIQGRTIAKVAVIGSGQIGPDIALHFAKVLAPVAGSVVVVDLRQAALDAGRSRAAKKIDKGAETGAWKPPQAEAMKAALAFTTDYAALSGADLVIEAATEDEPIKARIFAQVEAVVAPDAILLSNSSHLEPERIFGGLAHPGRAAVAHYFFPAERNPVVEIVPGAATEPQVTRWLMRFYTAIGKLPFHVASRYGYAVDPIFEGTFQAACLAVQQGLGSVKEVDFVARKALGMQVGPFTAMNLTGGNPLTDHGLDLMHQRFASSHWPQPWYRAPTLLKDKLAQDGGAPWQVCGRGETVSLPADQETAIVDALRGAYLGLAFGILDTGIIARDAYELCLETALDQKGPIRLCNEIGPAAALALVERYAQAHPTMPVPASLRAIAHLDRVDAGRVWVSDEPTEAGKVRVVTVCRPKVLNALDAATYREIAAALRGAEGDPEVVGVVITGQGTKAFASGADIAALAGVRTPQDGRALAELGQSVCRALEACSKPTVAAINGLAFGGGFELALGCRARVAVAGHKALLGLPEVNLGIIPGSGGTQRLPRLVGVERGLVLLRTAATLSSDEALQFGVVRALVPAGSEVDVAVQLCADVARGLVAMPALPEGPVADADAACQVDIGHRSRAVDAVLCEVVRAGARLGLHAGLEAELDGFARICSLQDMRIGVDTFVQQGPRAIPAFVHG